MNSATSSAQSNPSSSVAKTYTVTWKNYDGKVLETDREVQEGTMPHYDGADPTRPDDKEYRYTWTGWTPAIAAVTADQVYTATYSSSKLAAEYTIRYVLNGGTNAESNPSSYTEGSTFTFADPTRKGYTFAGWYDAKGNKVTGIDANTTGNLVLTAKWTANKNNLTVMSEDSSKGTVAITSGSGYSDESITVVATPATLHMFEGWYSGTKKVSKDATYTFKMPTEDYALVGKFVYDEDQAIKCGMIPVLSDDGMTMTYGLYPQKRVSDSSTITALGRIQSPESNGWYLYKGEYYAKDVASPRNAKCKFEDGTAITSGSTYWFKCEPIKWNVLSTSEGEYYLLSSLLLDAHCYYGEQTTRVIDNYLIYPNNYEHSDIRAWLNADFYNTAFALDSTYLLTSVIDNSADTTNSPANSFYCNNTLDKVFLPSYQDYINSDYGFLNSSDLSSTRYCKTTDWARAHGAYYSEMKSYLGCGSYWTRSPDTYRNSTYTSWVIISEGGIGFDGVGYAGDCVRPAVNLKLA